MTVPPFRSRGWRTGAGLAALLGGLALAAPAAAAPLDPTFPADDAVVGLRPAFTWEAAAAVPGRYEVYAELPGGPVEVAEVGGPRLTATATVALPDDTRLRWFVRAAGAPGSPLDTVLASRRHIQVATPPGAPAITGSPPAITRSSAPLFAWSGSRISSRWSVLDAAGAQVQSGAVGAPSGQVAPAALPDGSYQFRVAQRNLVGVEGPPAAVGFSVDTVAPGGADPAPLHGEAGLAQHPRLLVDRPRAGRHRHLAHPAGERDDDPRAGERRGRRRSRRRPSARGRTSSRRARPTSPATPGPSPPTPSWCCRGWPRGCACRCGTPGG